jgi:hypothetical protein
MAIASYLDDFDADPETKRVLHVALEMTRAALGLADDFANGIIAKQIVELARAGERHPDVLCEGALKKLRGHLFGVTTEDGSHAKLRMVWMESGGPLVQSPIRRGFGSTLIEQSITRELGGTLEKNFDPAGLSCTMLLPLERLGT